MGVIGSPGAVSVFVGDRKRAKEFYVRKVGLKVRDEIKGLGFLALGATEGGRDAGLVVWQPERGTWGEAYEGAVASIGTITGIGFAAPDLGRTVEALRRRGVRVSGYEPGGTFASFTDSDGNVLFLAGPHRPRVRRAGLAALAFVTVVTRDADRAGAWFTQALGMRRSRMPGEDGGEFVGYRLAPGGTMVGPFTPELDMYSDSTDYAADVAQIGEDTGIVFPTRDIRAAQEALMARGVRFAQKAAPTAWGGWDAQFLDPDGNAYTISQGRRRATRKP